MNRDLIKLAVFARCGRVAVRSWSLTRLGKVIPHHLVDGLLSLEYLLNGESMAYYKAARCAGLSRSDNIHDLVALGLVSAVVVGRPDIAHPRRVVSVSPLGYELLAVYCSEVTRVWDRGKAANLLLKYSERCAKSA